MHISFEVSSGFYDASVVFGMQKLHFFLKVIMSNLSSKHKQVHISNILFFITRLQNFGY